MSYEKDSSMMIKCPCKKGYIILEREISDWGQIKEHDPIIDCDVCSNKYYIESKYVCPKPRHDYTIYYLVDKKTKSKKIIDL